jgi:hypothetical protein
MMISRKIFFIWVVVMLLYAVSLPFADQEILLGSDIANRAIQLFLFILSIYIAVKEATTRIRAIFVNFSIFFGICSLMMLQPFMGAALFKNEPYAYFIFWQYTAIGYILFLSLAIIYLVIDLILGNLKIYHKYAVTGAILVTFFIFYFSPFFGNPLYLYTTEEIQQVKTLQNHIQDGQEIPTAAELASRVTLQAWRDGKPVGELFPEQNLKQIEFLLPYLEGMAWLVILTKPLYMNYIYMNILSIGFILLFFGYQYKKDPPQGAYIDKMMFLFLIYCSMEVLHFWEYMKSIEWNYYMEISNLGQYITIFVELLIALFFTLRLKFITSVQGEFYEAELARNPAQISRWRDWVDNLVLSHFFNSNPFIGRFFQSPSESNGLAPKMTAHPSNRGIYGKRH